jgi:hypothetical protein
MKQTRLEKALLRYPQAWRGCPVASLWTPKVRCLPDVFKGTKVVFGRFVLEEDRVA